jgi:hypothetical protein
MTRSRVLILACLLVSAASVLRAQERPFTVMVKGNLSTQSEIFLNPASPDPVARAQSTLVQDFLGFSVEVLYHFPGTNVALGVSADRISARTSQPITVSFREQVPAEDGYTAIPVDLTGYFIIPASGEMFKVFMGGGFGVYFGTRKYSIAGVEAGSLNASPGYGIHVLGGLSVHFTSWFSLVAEMKFRDLQFRSTNAFTVSRITYGSTNINVSQTPFASSIHTNGIVFQIGAGFSF